VLGVDLGTRRIGLAISDATETLATPLSVLHRGANHAADHTAIVATAREEEAQRIVVGWPRSLSGRDGPAARSVRDEVDELRTAAGDDLPVELHDERFTTVTATQHLRDAGHRRTRDSIDAAAAAVILQSYLDGPGRSGRNS
jgi:putative Holliday junction resolvase